MVYKIVKDGERDVIIFPNCCPFRKCDECSLLPKIMGAIEQVLKENPKWWK